MHPKNDRSPILWICGVLHEGESKGKCAFDIVMLVAQYGSRFLLAYAILYHTAARCSTTCHFPADFEIGQLDHCISSINSSLSSATKVMGRYSIDEGSSTRSFGIGDIVRVRRSFGPSKRGSHFHDMLRLRGSPAEREMVNYLRWNHAIDGLGARVGRDVVLAAVICFWNRTLSLFV